MPTTNGNKSKEVEEEVKATPKKVNTKKVAKESEVVAPVSYISIEQFLASARYVYKELNPIVESGFKASLEGKTLFSDELVLKEKLDKYLGK